MTITDYIMPMRKKNIRVVFIVYEGFELLDLSGPTSVFSMANYLSGKPLYSLLVVSENGLKVKSGCGVEVSTVSAKGMKISKNDFIFVLGSERPHLEKILQNKWIKSWLNSAARKAAVVGSICTGSFILGSAGILSGKRATTHWEGSKPFSRLFPRVILEAHKLYVNDGKYWTSAGVSTGIDMTLALVESGHGTKLKSQIAKRLVVHSHRAGDQRQFSDLLIAQEDANEVFSKVVEWMDSHMTKDLLMEDLAAVAGMSLRTFYRSFTLAFDETPAKYLTSLRLEKAKDLLEAGKAIKSVLKLTGFRSEANFRKCFREKYGVPPSVYKITVASSYRTE